MNRLALVITGVAVFAASAFAAKVCEEVDTEFVGVDADGNLSAEQAGEVHCRECVSTRSGKYTLKCVGTVGNESGKGQTFKNPPGVFEELDKVIYKVKANGNAKLTAKGFIEEL